MRLNIVKLIVFHRVVFFSFILIYFLTMGIDYKSVTFVCSFMVLGKTTKCFKG